jgi:hypothetical protein
VAEQGVFTRMDDKENRVVTSNFDSRGKFAPGNKAAAGANHVKAKNEWRKALAERFPLERRLKIWEDIIDFGYKFAEKYDSPRMLHTAMSRLADEIDGKPTQRVEVDGSGTPDDWLAAMRDNAPVDSDAT